MVTDDTAKSKKETLHPRLTLTGEKAKEAGVYRLAPGAIVAVEDGQQVEAGEVLARMPREAARTRDITGGLPRVAELFEARKPKENAIIAKVSGKVTFMRDYKAKRKIAIVPDDGSEPVEYLVPKSKMIEVQEGDFVKRGDNLVGGSPDPHDILEVLGVEALAEYLVERDPGGLSTAGREDQRQAHRGDRSPDAAEGRDHRRRRHHLARRRAGRPRGDGRDQRQARRRSRSRPKASRCCSASPRRSLQTRSFISAASFQETTRVLTEAAVQGKVDTLEGLKENVIVGRLIPAGTGAGMNRLRVAASSRDTALRARPAPDAGSADRAEFGRGAACRRARAGAAREPAPATIRSARGARAATASTPMPAIICRIEPGLPPRASAVSERRRVRVAKRSAPFAVSRPSWRAERRVTGIGKPNEDRLHPHPHRPADHTGRRDDADHGLARTPATAPARRGKLSVSARPEPPASSWAPAPAPARPASAGSPAVRGQVRPGAPRSRTGHPRMRDD